MRVDVNETATAEARAYAGDLAAAPWHSDEQTANTQTGKNPLRGAVLVRASKGADAAAGGGVVLLHKTSVSIDSR